MFIMGPLGDWDYYADSEENLNSPKKLEDYLNMDNSKASFVGEFLNGLPYSKAAYKSFYEGTDLEGNKITKKQGEHKPGYDLVSTFDKSISLLYASMNREQRREMDKIIREETSKIMLEDFKKYIVPSCKKEEYQEIDWTKTKLAMAVFTHYENRNMDPHYHSHINLLNFAEFTFKDGKTKTLAIDPINLFKAQKLLSAKLDFAIAKSLGRKFNISFQNVDGSLRVDGITQENIDKFSDRNKQLLNQFEQKKKAEGVLFSSRQELESAFDDEFSKSQKAKYLEEVRKGTAKQKEELSYNELMSHFDKVLKEKTPNLSFERVQFYKASNKLSRTEVIKKSVELIDGLVDKNSIFTKDQLQTELYRNFLGMKIEEDGKIKYLDVDNIFSFLKENQYFVEVENGELSTKEVIEKSFEAIEKVKSMKILPFHIKASTIEQIEKNEKFNGFNNTQKQAMLVATNSSKISHITGDAGTGKTSSVIAYAADYYKSLGCEVIGLSTQGKTAQALEEVGIDKTFNIEKFTRDVDAGKTVIKFGSVLMIDEAGMVSANHYHKLLSIAEKSGSKLVLVGDNKQLSSVAYGNMFTSIEKELDKSSKSRLDANVRQKTQNQIDIAEAFRDKKPEKAIELLRNNKNLYTSMKKNSREDLANQLVEKYFSSEFERKVVIAFKNDDVNYLNDKIRGRLAETGRLEIANQVSIDVMTSSSSKKPASRNFTVGDSIVLTGNLKKTKTQPRVDNGTLATIKEINHKQIICIDGNGNEFSFFVDKFNQFNHSYALTTYKSQGATVQEAFIYSDGKTTSNQSYVDFSRHTDKVSLFIDERNLDNFISNSKKGQERFDITQSDEAKSIYKSVVDEKQKAFELERLNLKNICDDINRFVNESRLKAKEFSSSNGYFKDNKRAYEWYSKELELTFEYKKLLEKNSLKTNDVYKKSKELLDGRINLLGKNKEITLGNMQIDIRKAQEDLQRKIEQARQKQQQNEEQSRKKSRGLTF